MRLLRDYSLSNRISGSRYDWQALTFVFFTFFSQLNLKLVGKGFGLVSVLTERDRWGVLC